MAGLHRSPLFWLAPAGFRRFICPPRDLSLSASWRWRGAVSFLCQSQSSRPTPERGVCVSRGGGTFHTGEGFASGSRPSTLAPGPDRGGRYKRFCGAPRREDGGSGNMDWSRPGQGPARVPLMVPREPRPRSCRRRRSSSPRHRPSCQRSDLRSPRGRIRRRSRRA